MVSEILDVSSPISLRHKESQVGVARYLHESARLEAGFLRLAHLPKDEDHPYGHHRFSTLAALLISSLVLLFCLGLAWQSLSGLVSGAEVKQPGLAAAWVAGAGRPLRGSNPRQ